MPDYDFSQLSAFDFEMLVHSLLEKEWGCRLEAFTSGRDKGIDLRYSCPRLGSETIIQCKHYIGSGFSKLLSHLKKDEAPKVSALTPDRYVLVTSVGLTPNNKDDIQKALAPHIRSTGDIIGQTEINKLEALQEPGSFGRFVIRSTGFATGAADAGSGWIFRR
jgi:hypothetical protein